MRLNVGVIGLGTEWDSRHRPALLALSDRFQVQFICDEVTLKAESAARQLQARAVNGYRRWISEAKIDAVLALAPQWYGCAPLLAACEFGKAFYCGSTLDLSLARKELIQTDIDSAGIAFMAEFPRRFAPATTRLKELIATHLGPPRMVFCHERLKTNRSIQNYASRHTFTSIRKSVVELADWCSYIIGSKPNSVLALEHHQEKLPEKIDYQMINLEYPGSANSDSNITAQISCGKYLSSKWPEADSFRTPAALQVCCENGVAFVDLPTSLIWFDEAGRHMESLENERPIGEQLFSMFHRSVTSLVRNQTCLGDVRDAMNVMIKAEQSAVSGQRLPL